MTDAPDTIWAWNTANCDGDWTIAEGQGIAYTRSDIYPARIAQLELERDGWMVMVGEIAATIPVKDTIGATGTLGDMIEYLKGNPARIAQLEAALVYYRDEYCEHGGDLCGRLSSDVCGGCNAATALKAKP
jgi:hypothetical protein